MTSPRVLFLASGLVLAGATLTGPALADPVPASQADGEWSGTGELGLSTARGNSRADNFNGRVSFTREDPAWRYRFSASGLRARSEAPTGLDDEGNPTAELRTTANRYQAAASAALKLNERGSWISSLRHERDDFATYAWQSTLSVGYGHIFIDDADTKLSASLGPGYRRARNRGSAETEGELIARGSLEFARQITPTTRLVNELLIEGGDDNVFTQNDLGLAVAINAGFSLRAGLQVRHNTEVAPGLTRTDTLSTLNLVYRFR